MATATIVDNSARQDGTYAYIAFRVEGDGTINGASVAVEYQASTPLRKGDGTAKTNAELKADLITAAKAQRDAQKVTTSLLPISGAVNI